MNQVVSAVSSTGNYNSLVQIFVDKTFCLGPCFDFCCDDESSRVTHQLIAPDAIYGMCDSCVFYRRDKSSPKIWEYLKKPVIQLNNPTEGFCCGRYPDLKRCLAPAVDKTSHTSCDFCRTLRNNIRNFASNIVLICF